MSGPNLTSSFSQIANPAGKNDYTGLFQEHNGPVKAVFDEYSEQNGQIVREQKLYTAEQLEQRRHAEMLNPNAENRAFNLRQIGTASQRMDEFQLREIIAAKVEPIDITRTKLPYQPPGFTPNMP